MPSPALTRSVFLLAAIASPVLAQERIDAAAIARIKDEGLNRSQVMETSSWLTDVYGPRLANSPNYRKAADWTVATMKKWGLVNAQTKNWGDWGAGWEQERFSAQVLTPTPYPVIAYLGAWSGGTNGVAVGDVVYVPRPTTMAELDKLKGTLRGKWVMLDSSRSTPTAGFTANATRVADSSLVAMTRTWETYTPPVPGALPEAPSGRGGRGAGAGGGGRGGAGAAGAAPIDTAITNGFTRLVASEPLGVLRTGRGTDGTVFVSAASGANYRTKGSPRTLPQVYLIPEHYGRIYRTVTKGIPVKLEVEAKVRFLDDDASRQGFNVLGEITGTDPALRNQVVMIGGHFDSWHTGTGATDNIAGSATMLEAMRILKTLNLPMKRTVRIGLWGAEEQGLHGSNNYVRQTFTDTATRRPNAAHANFQAYFNVDNGGGAIRGIYLQQNDSIGRIFKQWGDALGMGTFGINRGNTGGTDHQAFDAAGIDLPGFQFVQDGLDYSSRTHHSNMDVYEKLIPDDMKRNATIVAAFVYLAANRDQQLPRKPYREPVVAGGRGGPGGM